MKNCHGCGSPRQRAFSGEVGIHFPGIEGLNKPLVFVFPKLSVCFDCGIAQFIVPEKELQVLVTGNAASSGVA